MTPATDTEITARWSKRLRARERLLKTAEEDLREAGSDAERAAARARVELRRAQIATAQKVIARHSSPSTTARERAVRAAMLGYKNRDSIVYTQHPTARWDGISRGRRAHKNQFPSSADCSSFVTWCLWDALGGPNAGPDIVNGHRWAAGYTGTQQSHGRRVPLNRAQIGDLVFYREPKDGISPHVAIVVAPGKVISHGSNPGPLLLAIDYRPILEVRSYLP